MSKGVAEHLQVERVRNTPVEGQLLAFARCEDLADNLDGQPKTWVFQVTAKRNDNAMPPSPDNHPIQNSL